MNERSDRAAARWMRVLCSGWVLMTATGIGQAAFAEPLYQVEVLVFQRLGDEPAGAGPAAPMPPPRPEDAMAMPPPELPTGSLLLNDAVRRLDGSGRYRTLLHVGWRQNALQTQPMRIGDAPGLAETGVSGIGSVKVGQQLAMQLSIACQLAGQQAWLRARRNIRIGELHYVDHRLCGALMQVTRVPETIE